MALVSVYMLYTGNSPDSIHGVRPHEARERVVGAEIEPRKPVSLDAKVELIEN